MTYDESKQVKALGATAIVRQCLQRLSIGTQAARYQLWQLHYSIIFI